MVAYGTMQESASFRSLCRAKNIPNIEVNEVAKDLDKFRNNPKWRDLILESEQFIGVIDSISPHACAVLLLSEPISSEIGVMRVGDGKGSNREIVNCAIIDSSTSDTWKYLKND